MTKYLDFEGLKHFKNKIDAEYKPALNGKADSDIGLFTIGVATPELTLILIMLMKKVLMKCSQQDRMVQQIF